MYVCRDEELINLQLLKRMKQRDGVVRPVTCEDNIRCCDIIPQMNHWWRDGQKRFRCAAGGHPFRPYADAGTKKMPGYILCLYGNDGVTYIRAEVPNGKAATKLALLKIMMEPKNLLAIVHDATSFADFWKAIDSTCNEQFCIVQQHCTKVHLQVPQPRFQLQETRTSLKSESIGQELPMLYVDPAELEEKVFSQQDWENFMDRVFAHFVIDKVTEESWQKMSKNDHSLLREMAVGGERIDYTTQQVQDMMAWLALQRVGQLEPTTSASSSTP